MTKIIDALRKPEPDAVQLHGLIGQRIDGSRLNRLRRQEEDHLLWPFQEHCPVGYYPDHPVKPGIRSDWQGEFMGTWLDAAVLSCWNAGDQALKQKIDGMVSTWLDTQADDGYLGTYDEPDRWKSWDIWIQAHAIIGLISYYRFTGKKPILQAAVRVADRFLADFGPGKRGLGDTGPHMGMASSAILEPLMWLYQETLDERYLAFGRWLVDVDWESPAGPHIVSSLLNGRGVAGTANGKGIEMLITFAGLLELYRACGESRYLRALELAWEDIVSHHLYLTGSASTGEYFPKDFALNNDGFRMIGETCVSMGWLYLNLGLARLSGDARYFDMVEQTLYNHLMSAQSSDGQYWAYYVGLRDSKRYRWHTDPECCPSRGVRAIAQMPEHIFSLTDDGVQVNFYEDAQASLRLKSGNKVAITMESGYPFDGKVILTLNPSTAENFTLRLRLPGWNRKATLTLNDQLLDTRPDKKGYLPVGRGWTPGDRLELTLDMPVLVAIDRIGNNGRAAIVRGPLVYAADSAYLPGGVLLDDLTLAVDAANPGAGIRLKPGGLSHQVGLHLVAQRIVQSYSASPGVWREPERYASLTAATDQATFADLELAPFFEAGNLDPQNTLKGIHPNDEAVRKATFQVWLPYR